jgi:hypothetical protein
MAVKDKNAGADLAKEMASRWSDEVLKAKTPEDLSRAYGVSEGNAEDVLRNEKFRRGMNYE